MPHLFLVAGGRDVKTGKDVVQFLDDERLAGLIEKTPFTIIYPVIDGSYLVDHPMYLFAKGHCAKVDVVFGFCTNEGYHFIREVYRADPDALAASRAQEILDVIIRQKYFARHPNADQIYHAVFEKFLNGVVDSDLLYQRLCAIWGYLFLMAPVMYAAICHTEAAGEANTFVYQLDHRPSFRVSPAWVTARHSDDIPFVIGEPFLDHFPDFWSKDEVQLCRSVMTFWSNFAKHGNPNGNGTGIEWPQFSGRQGKYLVLRTPPEINDGTSDKQMEFWLNDIGSLTPPSSASIAELSKL